MNEFRRGRRKNSAVVLVISIVCAFLGERGIPVVAGVPQDKPLEVIVSGISARAMVLRKVHAHMKRTIYNVPVPEDRHRLDLRKVLSLDEIEVHRKGEKLRLKQSDFDLSTGKHRSISFSTWDGQRCRGYSEFPQMKRDPTGGLICAHQGGMYDLGHHLCAIEKRVFELDSTLADLVRKGDWKAEGTVVIDDTPTVLICGPAGPGMRLEAWIAPSRGFAPLKMRLTIDLPEDKRIIQELTDVKLKQVDGAWMPVQCAVLTFNPQAPEIWQVCEFEIDEIECGVEYPDDLFVLKFPPGKDVYDKITGLVYRVREDGGTEPVFFHGGDVNTNVDLEPENRLDNLSIEPDRTVLTTGRDTIKKQDPASDSGPGVSPTKTARRGYAATNIWLSIISVIVLSVLVAGVRRYCALKRKDTKTR